jgi:hypothetical protein
VSSLYAFGGADGYDGVEATRLLRRTFFLVMLSDDDNRPDVMQCGIFDQNDQRPRHQQNGY